MRPKLVVFAVVKKDVLKKHFGTGRNVWFKNVWVVNGFCYLFIYLFTAVSLQLWRKTMIFYGEEDVNWNQIYVIQWPICLKCMLKSLKYTWWSWMYQLK